jgi:glycosyltransferase involved in cell wall biosynthesis
MNLIFIGALGIRMNLDALTHFAARYWPAFRARFGDAVTMTVAGSEPLKEVSELCAREGWGLAPNVSEERLGQLYAGATFSLLPFEYATGAKLKLLAALARGVPVLSTNAVGAQASLIAPPSLMADDPSEWVAHAARVREDGIDDHVRRQLRAVAETHSWDHSADLVISAISDA